MKTPFVEYQLLELSSSEGVRSVRGYNERIGIWEKFDEIREIADRVGIRNRKFRKDILAAGPCPGLWRIYYAATAEVQKDVRVDATEYLGYHIEPGISRRALGIMFDDWVAEANRHYNAFLETGDPYCLKEVKGIVGAYYRERANTHCTVMADPKQRAKTKLQIKPDLRGHDLSLHDLTPDGVFSEGARAAIFEAKLSHPRYREFPHEMAVYAITYERTYSKDADYAIVLYTDYPIGKRLFTDKEPVLDSQVHEVSSNIERFLRLAQLSEDAVRDSIMGGIRTRIKLGHGSWKTFLRRPPGLPSQNERQMCPSCKYRVKCYQEGGES